MATGIEKVIERQDWLGTVENGLQQVASFALGRKGVVGQKLRNFLHGTWLGHPLHPVLTDIPVGAWTASTIFDITELATGSKRFQTAADATIGIGLIGAASAAVTGLNDWQHTDGAARRVGALHGLLNASASSLFLSSWLLRRQGYRPVGQALSFVGYAVAFASAYLGGKLVYDERVGVDHAPRTELPEDFVAVLPEDQLGENQLRRVEANGIGVLLVKRGGTIHAIAETCAHLGGPLAEGKLEGNTVRCPWHGSRYSLETGEVVEGPSVFPQPCFETRVRDGQIEVRHRKPQEVAEVAEEKQPVTASP